ncbi:hypothetical protein [Photobacterium kishitanii]|uniref:hypothetical protein n=1 Tax=Photobacterium kishitanii TaxID=318456 RepID=UPI0007F940DB|nr:hypothetical protein [Photobacterium kishitanii]OBU31889.1 hypothetical protein AYY23_17990 [Photobacterium kishitanii]PSU19436.1 hypothetical protein CTM84_16275 [Photobacterium kishitanii]PSV12698.1 hypothetical protein C0W59_17565 [Photobacterium kishitanii]PSW47184.1 hypothetical protein C0W66_19275 [Photobacterium kishitanii]PSW60090.1 hypothetical protein C0W54_17495 [Photobacterium kishitanii]
MARFLAISPKSQCWLFHLALILNILGMALTDMWLPMVVGAIITAYLAVDSLVRLRYVLPLKKEIRDLRHELEVIRHNRDDI